MRRQWRCVLLFSNILMIRFCNNKAIRNMCNVNLLAIVVVRSVRVWLRCVNKCKILWKRVRLCSNRVVFGNVRLLRLKVRCAKIPFRRFRFWTCVRVRRGLVLKCVTRKLRLFPINARKLVMSRLMRCRRVMKLLLMPWNIWRNLIRW